MPRQPIANRNTPRSTYIAKYQHLCCNINICTITSKARDPLLLRNRLPMKGRGESLHSSLDTVSWCWGWREWALPTCACIKQINHCLHFSTKHSALGSCTAYTREENWIKSLPEFRPKYLPFEICVPLKGEKRSEKKAKLIKKKAENGNGYTTTATNMQFKISTPFVDLIK